MCDTTDALKFNAVETLHRSKNREHAFAVPNVKVNYLVTEKLEQRRHAPACRQNGTATACE